MKSSELIELLASLKPTLPVRVRDGSEMLFIGQVYHEPLNTFIQGAVIEGKYSTVQALLDRLRHIDKIIPFDTKFIAFSSFRKIYRIIQILQQDRTRSSLWS